MSSKITYYCFNFLKHLSKEWGSNMTNEKVGAK